MRNVGALKQVRTNIEQRQAQCHKSCPLLVQLILGSLHQRLKDRAGNLSVGTSDENEPKREGR